MDIPVFLYWFYCERNALLFYRRDQSDLEDLVLHL